MDDIEPTEAQTAEGWRADLAYLAQEMEKRHKNLYHTVTRAQFAAAVEQLGARLPALAGHERIVELARLVALIGDAHTTMYLRRYDPAIQFHYYPLRLWLLQGVLFVRATDRAHQHLLGAPVIRVGTCTPQEAIARVRPIISAENEMRRQEWAPALLVVPEVLHALGITESLTADPFVVDVDGAATPLQLPRLPDGAAVDWVDASDRAPAPKPLWLRDPEDAFWFDYLADSRTLYLQYNAAEDKPEETLAAFFARMFAFVAEHAVDRFVIDLRWNGGGDNSLNWPLIYGIIRAEALNQRGKLFTIIGRRTFSAAMNCATALERHTHTLFVGEPTGNSPNQYGDAVRIVLPHSGVSVFVSTLYWQESLPDDARPWIAPHIAADLTRELYLANRDPALEAILRYQG